MVPYNYKLLSFFSKSLNKSFIDHIVIFEKFQVVFTISSFVGNPVESFSFSKKIEFHNPFFCNSSSFADNLNFDFLN